MSDPGLCTGSSTRTASYSRYLSASEVIFCIRKLPISFNWLLDEYWSLHPELHEIPIYYASSLAQKCMAVYQVLIKFKISQRSHQTLIGSLFLQTYINAMNDKIRRQIAINNPFIFKHISSLKVQ